MIKENLTDQNIRNNWQFSSCCGSNYLEGGEAKPDRKWKNQYGEGVIKGTTGTVDPIKGNRYGIVLADGFQGTAGPYDKGTVSHIKTKNGNITIGIRERN